MADLPVSGAIAPDSFPFLVVDLHGRSATGSLKVAGPSYQKALYFRAGRVLFGSSNDPRDQLGAILIESGKITPEQLDDVSSKVGPGSPLAKVLTDTGFVNQRELSEAARAKVERILSDVLAYDSGSFEFEDGVLPKGAVDLKLTTERVIVAAVRRIADRNFVLRYIDGMEAVLRPTADMHARTAEIETDTSGITHYLDGARTLKEAAGLARLDEFEAAKIACALLFLGAVERVPVVDLGAIAADAQTPAAPSAIDTPFMIDAEAPAVIGMEPTAGEPGTISMEPEAPALAAEAAPEDFALDPPAAVTISMAGSDAPLVMTEPENGFAMADEAAAPTPSRRVYDVPPLVPPPPKEEPIRVTAPSPAAPPSAGDLKALDELLNPRLEGPRAALERGESARATARAEAPGRSGTSSGAPRSARKSSSSRAPLALGALAAVALAAGAGWFFLVRPRPPASDARADAPPPVSTLPAEAPPPPVTEAPAMTQPPAITPATTAAAPKAGSDPRVHLQQGDLAEAGRLFARELRAAGPGAFAAQLFISCSTENLQKAVAEVGTQQLVIFPTRFNGRDCYRVAWGIHGSSADAVRSLQNLPEYFRKDDVKAKVVPAAEILR